MGGVIKNGEYTVQFLKKNFSVDNYEPNLFYRPKEIIDFLN